MIKACSFFLFFILAGFRFAAAQNPVITTIINEVNIDSLIYRVEEISGERSVTVYGITDTIKSRHKSKPGNELCYDFIQQTLSSYGLQTDSLLFGTVGKNALAIQPGLLYPSQYYIICAHYDDMPNATVAPAADDDGSGVGAVLEAARILSQYQFEYTIVYALWDEEEQGLAGSAAYASLANTNNDSIKGVINLDAIAWDSDSNNVAMIHTHTTGNSLVISSAIDNVNNTYGLGLDLTIQNPGATYSDHASFWTNGFPAILLIEDWTFDSNPHYHTVTDRVMYFNVPYYEKMAKLAIASIATLAVPATGNAVSENKIPAISIYPNPVRDILQINFPATDLLLLQVMDCRGRIIFSKQTGLTQKILLDVSQWQNGLYFIHATVSGNRFTSKFIKK